MVVDPGKLTWERIHQQIHAGTIQSQLSIPERVEQTYQYIQAEAKTKRIYGVNTGFGKLASETIEPEQITVLQRNLVLSHASGVGEPLGKITTQLMMLFKLNSLAQGYSGVRTEVIQLIANLLEHDVYPKVPSQGSVGASGDLAPLAHMAMTLIGEGELFYQDEWQPAQDVLAKLNLKPLVLEAKEGLALLNGLQASTAIAVSALYEFEKLFQWALIAGAMSTDAIKGSDLPFSDLVQDLKLSGGQSYVGRELTALLQGSEVRESHQDCSKVQDPYSFRCQPQIMGACYEQMQFAKSIMVRESNAVSDNPLIFSDEKQVISGGNFHGEAVAMACDNLALAIAEVGSVSERRQAEMIDPNMSGLPAFLVKDSGVNSGFMMAQVTSAALVSENKLLAMPRSIDSIPTSANQEDHVSMATNAALRLNTMCDNLRNILAVELLAGAQAIDFHRPLKSSAKIEEVYALIRAEIPFYDQDRYFAADIEKMTQLMQN